MAAVFLFPAAALADADGLLRVRHELRHDIVLKLFLAAGKHPYQEHERRYYRECRADNCNKRQQCAPVLNAARRVLPVGIYNAHGLHRAAAELLCKLEHTPKLEAAAVFDYLAAPDGERLLRHTQREILDGVCHNKLIASYSGVLDELRIAVVRHVQPAAGGVCGGAEFVLLALDHACDHVRHAVYLHAQSGDVRAAVEQPGQILIQQDAILHQVTLRDVAAADEPYRVKIEEFAADGDDRGLALAVVAADVHLAGAAPRIDEQRAVVVDVERRLVQLLGELRAEGGDLLKPDLLVHGDEAAYLRKLHVALAAPAGSLLLAGERVRQDRGRDEAGGHYQQQRAVDDGEYYSFFLPVSSFFHVDSAILT